MKGKMQGGKRREKLTSGLLGLRVVVMPDEDAFFAQGFDVDYFASGQTREEAEKNFEDGLSKLVELHLDKFGTVERLRKPAPNDVTQAYSAMQFSTLDRRSLSGVAAKHLGSKVLYLVP